MRFQLKRMGQELDHAQLVSPFLRCRYQELSAAAFQLQQEVQPQIQGKRLNDPPQLQPTTGSSLHRAPSGLAPTAALVFDKIYWNLNQLPYFVATDLG